MSHKSAIAKPTTYDDALITSMVRYGEADCIVRLFTKNGGRLSAFFKRGLAMKKGIGSVQAPLFSRVGLIEHTHGLTRLVSSDLDPTSIISCSLRVFAYRSYLAELIEKMLPEAEAAPEIFSLTEDTYAALITQGAKPAILRAFELKLLDYCGYLPEFPGSDTAVLAFDPMAQRFTSEHVEGCWPFSKQAVALAHSMLIAKVGSISYEGSELMMIGRLFQNRLKLMGLLPLKSVDFLKQLSGRKL
jgi:DNA repair protein RecO